ncbi:uncharacterized protein EV420DRAFT_1479439 [Desarmillaria tabescens]|uniref:Uncharacterized protein n=1 Tax=Armillaria tabescens TaxID=1929756 RepID=A0AA39N5K6_ARMTA|nr:uncharacterized protein EV420DRAFT_1479439 [Desarmillaria tabescens]KAK0458747.1 hypothetical protein EV420DRAFT_1479439 [Desarmillaria tabescens]
MNIISNTIRNCDNWLGYTYLCLFVQIRFAHWVSDEGLTETLKMGIGYFHEAMDSLGAVWSILGASDMLIIMGVQYYEGKQHRYIDYLNTDVLQIMGRDTMKRVLTWQQTRRDLEEILGEESFH